MLVGDVLNLAAQLSIGLDAPTEDDKKIFLGYLNLASSELFSYLAPVNTSIPIQRDELDVSGGVVEPLSRSVFSIRSVYSVVSNVPLTRTNYDLVIEKDPKIIMVGEPTQWYYINNELCVWPIATQRIEDGGGIGVIYNVNATDFGLNDDLDVYYPPAYQRLLVYGTCYYLFQSEAGFNNASKSLDFLRRWEEGKTNLFNYFVSLGGKTSMSTFRWF